MCSLFLPYYFFLNHPYDLLSTHDVDVGCDVKPEIALGVLWPYGIPNTSKRCQAPAKPMLGQSLVPVGNHFILAQRRTSQRGLFKFSISKKMPVSLSELCFTSSRTPIPKHSTAEAVTNLYPWTQQRRAV